MNETEAQTAAGSLVEELRALTNQNRNPAYGAVAYTVRVACEIATRHEAASQAERDRLQAEFDKARASERALRRERKGEVWYWQGDEYDHLESLTCPVLIEAGDLREIVVERDRLNYEISLRKAAYQEYIDAHKKEKDRADRAEQAGAERDRLQSRITKLEHQAAERNAGYDALFRSCEAHRERADRCEGALVADRRAIGNLLTRIFGDGGYRQQAIGDLTAACAEAESVVLADLQALMNMRAGLSALLDESTKAGTLYRDVEMVQCAEIMETITRRLTALLAASSSPGAGGGAGEEGSVGT